MKTVLKLQVIKKYLITLLSAITLLQSYQGYTYQAPYNEERQSIPYQPEITKRLTISVNNHQIILSDNNRNYRQILVDDITNIPKHVYDIWISDFNYDGFSDIAIAVEEDDDGLNETYALFYWNPQKQQVQPMKGLNKVSNPEQHIGKKELKTVLRSSTHWIETTYRFHHGAAYVYRQTNMLLPKLWQTSIYGEDGKVTNTVLSKDGRSSGGAHPIIMPITRKQAWLYEEPLPSTKTQRFLGRNSDVTVLDYHRSQNHLDWILIRSHDTNPIERWILMDNVNLS